MKTDSILDQYIRNVSSLKTKPKKVRAVSYRDIERLNSSIEKKYAKMNLRETQV